MKVPNLTLASRVRDEIDGGGRPSTISGASACRSSAFMALRDLLDRVFTSAEFAA
jgi:hypothetical protein